MKFDKVMAKVRKLLALSNSPNSHEAEAAAELAHKLMMRYGLSSDATIEIKKLEVAEPRLIETWRWGLMTACARSYYCDCVRIEEEIGDRLRVTAIVYGPNDYPEGVVSLFNYLSEIILKMATARFSLRQADDLIAESLWKEGVVRGISERLEKSRMMTERETGGGEERAALWWDAVRAWKAANFTNGVYKPSVNSGTGKAFEEGLKIASGVTLPDILNLE